jgi:hypothetical protein
MLVIFSIFTFSWYFIGLVYTGLCFLLCIIATLLEPLLKKTALPNIAISIIKWTLFIIVFLIIYSCFTGDCSSTTSSHDGDNLVKEYLATNNNLDILRSKMQKFYSHC